MTIKRPNPLDAVLKTGAQSVEGVKTFGAIPILPASDPTADNEAGRKAFIDGKFADCAHLTGAQNVGGVKTFTSIPILPASDPTASNEATRKAYIDGKPLGRGGYTAVVYKEGSMFIAEDAEGNTIIENADAATVIQKAIDDYGEKGSIIVKPAISLTQSLKILKKYSNVEFLGSISSSGVNAIELGDATHQADGSRIKFGELNGINKAAHGIVFKNVAFAQIDFVIIKNCDVGMYFDAVTGGGARECFLVGGGILEAATAAVKFSTSTDNMEGNHFRMLIGHSPIGFELSSTGCCSYQTYIGVIDCVDTGGSVDIQDNRGKQFFLLDYVRREKSTIGNDTVLINVHGNYQGQAFFEARDTTVDFKNVGFTPMIIWDFNRDSTGDWSKSGCAMATPSKSVTRITASDGDPYIHRVISVDGGQAQLILIRYKYISGTKNDAIGIFYKTSGHDFSGSYKNGSHGIITDGEWHTVMIDMSDLWAGGTDWIDNMITAIRIDYTEAQAVYDIDYIAIGTRSYASGYHMDDGLKTPSAANAVGNKGDIRWDANYIYICTALNAWKRSAISTW